MLVVGAGPAGLAATLLLQAYGVKALTVTRQRWTADSPRAHYQNQRTLEVMRELGLEAEVAAAGLPDALMQNFVWASSLSGVEFARLPSYMAASRDDYLDASPCRSTNLAQHLMEPILARAALARGADIAWNREFMDLSQDAEGVTARVRDRLTGRESTVRARYLIGADGARSRVAEAAGLTLSGQAGWAAAVNVWFRADLTAYCAHRPGVLYIINRPGGRFWSGSGIFVNVRPWNEWVLSFMYDPAQGEPDLSEAALAARVRDLVGDPALAVELLSANPWRMNAQVADRMSTGRVLIAGDAAHRHPPTNGLGSNTSIQDAYNLAWKLKLVLDGIAGPELLDSYDLERRPVAQQVVERSMQSVKELGAIAEAIGFSPDQTEEEGWRAYAEVAAPDETGRAKREALRAAIDLQRYHQAAHGVELGFRYGEGALVGDADTLAARDSWRDRQLRYEPSARAGAHLPHAWLEREGRRVSTLDLAGRSRFALIVGHGGEPWAAAAREVAAATGLDLPVHRIGVGLDYADVFGAWERLRDIGDDGCLLVRPDNFVAWRSPTLPSDPAAALRAVVDQVLARGAPAAAPHGSVRPAPVVEPAT